MSLPDDARYMELALAMARRGIGLTAPNPSVGCVIAQNNTIIGRGTTAPGGRPHAEAIALRQAGNAAKGATAYVTLEPCSHYGQTPPCAQSLITAGIARVVIATQDSNPRVSGKGIAMLKDAGIDVTLGIGEIEARRINEGFFKVHEQGRPMVTLKLATTLDGNIAMASGESKWITNEDARRYAHMLRYQHDAIMVGVNTVKADNPELTCRLPGLEQHSPVRIIVDSQLSTPTNAKLITAAGETPTWILTTRKHTSGAFPKPVTTYTIPANAQGQVDMQHALHVLAGQGITRILAEGGAQLAASLLNAKLVDQLIWFHAPKIIGRDGISGIGELENNILAAMPHFKRESLQILGKDIMEIYRPL